MRRDAGGARSDAPPATHRDPMRAYVVKRLLAGVVVLWGVSVLVFGLIRLLPGDVVTAIMAESGKSNPAEEARLRHALGLDEPAVTQYVKWIGGVLRGDFGTSLWSGRSVVSALGDRIPVTLELAALAMVMGLIVAVPIGVISAIRQGSALDYGSRVFAILGVSIPDFVLGSLLLAWLVTTFHWAPSITYIKIWEDPGGNLAQYVLPAAILGYRLAATTMRMTRSAVLEILREDYIRTAWSKGLRERKVILRHAMPNALVPVVTIAGLQIGYLFAGSVVIETVFNLPGMGKLLVQSVTVRDYPQVQAFVLLVSAVMVLINIAVDLSYSVLDPRVRAR